MTLNCNGLINKADLIRNLLICNNLDCLYLQETKCFNTNSIEFSGYNIHHLSPADPNESNNPYHGVAIIIRKELRAEKFSPPICPSNIDKECFARVLSLKLVDFDTVITNVYLPAVRADCSSDENNDRLEDVLNYIDAVHVGQPNVILGGDLNYDYLRDKDSLRWHIIEDRLASYHKVDLPCLKDDDFTFRSFQWNDCTRYLDRILVTIDPRCVVSYQICHDQDIGSDHLPILVKLVLEPVEAEKLPEKAATAKLNWSKAKPSQITAYRQTVTKAVSRLLSEPNLEYDQHTMDTFISILTESATNHIPKVKLRKQNSVASELWLQIVKPSLSRFQGWTKLLNSSSKNSQEYNYLKRMKSRAKLHLKMSNKNFQRLRDQEIAEKLQDGSDIFKCIGKNKAELHHPPKLLDGKKPTEQLQNWHDHYTRTFQGKATPKQLPKASAEVKNIVLSEREIRMAIAEIDTSKSYERHHHYKYLPDLAIKFLTSLLNGWLRMTSKSTLEPWSFMHSVISPILKSSEKPTNEIKSFRPIALASSEAWLLEKICLRRCLPHFKTDDCLFGYKANHSTNHAIQIAKALSEKDDVHVALLDASSAFDKISHERIIAELHRRNIPENLIRFILALTFSTFFTIKWFGQETTSRIYPYAGVKQGGVLSAYLFSITYDVLASMMKETPAGASLYGQFIQAIIYADDIALAAITITGLYMLYGVVQKFCALYGDIQMNPIKSQILRVGRKKLSPISICGIPTASSGKYLGAILTQNNLRDLEFRRCRRALYSRYNGLIRHNSSLRHFSERNRRTVLDSYGVPYSIETLEKLPTTITAPHRSMTMHLFPRSYGIKDANNVTIRSRTLYQTVAKTKSLPEIHRIRRNNFILSARNNSNKLIAAIVGKQPTI